MRTGACLCARVIERIAHCIQLPTVARIGAERRDDPATVT
jgi:hypothetical protein